MKRRPYDRYTRQVENNLPPTPIVIEGMRGLTLEERVVVKCLVFPMLPKSLMETAVVIGSNHDKVKNIQREALAKIRAVMEASL